jgi:pyrroline-5-carboxylate reductase
MTGHHDSSAPERTPVIAFIGGGNMARALIAGLRARGHDGAALQVADPNRDALDQLAGQFGIRAADDAGHAVAGADAVVLAVKPQVLAQVCAGLASALGGARPTVISIAAGVRSDQIDAWLGGGRAVVRTMPNTPAQLGAGATGLFANRHCSGADRALAESLLAAVGATVWLGDEALMDAVTAVSGSGPAYVFRLVEALQAAARDQGLPADAARTLVLHTVLGAARMAQETGEDAAALRRQVTSPGGTTAAAMQALDVGGFDALVAAAVAAATVRGRELSAPAPDPDART